MWAPTDSQPPPTQPHPTPRTSLPSTQAASKHTQHSTQHSTHLHVVHMQREGREGPPALNVSVGTIALALQPLQGGAQLVAVTLFVGVVVCSGWFVEGGERVAYDKQVEESVCKPRCTRV